MQGGSGGTATGQNPFSWGNFQIGGAFANQSAEYLDGQPLNIGYINLPILIPTQDSIGEFKVQTNNLGPEWGRLAGGVLNLSTKSGSNAWHGEAYEYIRNKVLNANDWFANNAGLARPPFTQNQFGGNIGGRVIRDKTFFFEYEGFRLRQGQTFTATVPTAAERGGDVSALAPVSSVPGNQIVDPCDGAATCTTYSPVPFSGNVIPTARLNPTALALLNLYPAPTLGTALNNYTTNTSTGGNQNQYVGRVDQSVRRNQHLFARFSWCELPGGFFADLAYGGLKGTHLPQYSQQIDQIPDQYLFQAAQQVAAGKATPDIAVPIANPYVAVASPGSGLSSATILAGNLLRPHPQYSGVSLAGQGSFGSNYNSLQATLQRRFNGGGTLLAAYTYSKLLSNTDTITSWLEGGGAGAIQDWNNLPSEYSLSSQDVPQRLIVSYVLDLPFGHGKP